HDLQPYPNGIPVAGKVGTFHVPATGLLVRVALRAPLGKGSIPFGEWALLLIGRWILARVAAEPTSDQVQIRSQLCLFAFLFGLAARPFQPVAHRPKLGAADVVR